MDVEQAIPDTTIVEEKPIEKYEEPIITPLIKKPLKAAKRGLGQHQGKIIILLVGMLGVQAGIGWYIRSKTKNHQVALTLTTTALIAIIGASLVMFCK